MISHWRFLNFFLLENIESSVLYFVKYSSLREIEKKIFSIGIFFKVFEIQKAMNVHIF